MTPRTHLVAVSRPLGPHAAVDPFALAGSGGIAFVGEGRALVGLGVAATIPLPHGLDEPDDLAVAAARLASIPLDERSGPSARAPGNRVLAFGALPFDRSAPGELVVPETIVGIEPSGDRWVTVVTATEGPGGHAGLPADAETFGSRLRSLESPQPGGARPGSGAGAPQRAQLAPLSTDDSFRGAVEEALAAIDRGELGKVVLARQVEVTAEDPFDVGALLRRWHRLEPGCTAFSVPADGGCFVGASPELLVERAGVILRSRPLAGTTDPAVPARGASDGLLPAELLASRKDTDEHRFVVDDIARRLGPFCSALDVPDRPDLVRLHDIVHLGTSITGRLADRGPGRVPSVLDLVAALHPTPAVGGVPTDAARRLIARLEPRTRGRYAGPVGYLDARGDGRFVLGIRAVSIRDRRARLVAGAGIVEGSDPVVELAETTLKLNSVLDAVAPDLRLPMPATRHRHRVVS